MSPLPAAGKSTLLNAILCDSILPSNNVPETARIIAISHADVAEPRLSYTGPDGAAVEVEGAAAIHEHLRQLNAFARGSERALAADERPLEIEVAVAALAGIPAGAPGSRLTILDTPGKPFLAASVPQTAPDLPGQCQPVQPMLPTPPLVTQGPNEAGEDALRYKVERLAEGLDALLYLLDYTKLKTKWACIAGRGAGGQGCEGALRRCTLAVCARQGQSRLGTLAYRREKTSTRGA